MTYAYMILGALLIWAASSAWGDCTVSVDGRAIYDRTDADGNPRNNPDHTLYPNDVFGFEFAYRFGSECLDPHVGTIHDTGAAQKLAVRGPENSPVPAGSGKLNGHASILVPEANRCHGAPPYGGGWDGYGGAPGQPRQCGGLSLTVWAYKLVCGQTCQTVRVSATDAIRPDVIPPMMRIHLERHMLHDMQGYPAVNLDATYYAWDPAAVIHRAEFMHKDDRDGTITFRYQRAHPPLHEEGGFSCDKTCLHALQPSHTPAGTGFLPYHNKYGNGDGAYAYSAPAHAAYGGHVITYNVDILNEGVLINSQHAQTVMHVVPYEPVFSHHPYTVLSDGAPRAYSDRQGILLRYEGSAAHDAIHPDRRAKITNFYPRTVAYSAANLEPLTMHGMTWNSSWGWPYDTGYDAAVAQFRDMMDGHPALPPHPVHATTQGGCRPAASERHYPFGCHVMFMHASHGAVRFWQDVGVHVLPESPRWYDNVTTDMVLASDDWAGMTRHDIINYTYQYPHALLAHNLTMSSPQDMRLEARVTPYRDGGPHRIIMPVNQYIYEKTLHDTGDDIMALMAASEVYDTVQHGTGRGTLHMSLNKTALQFWDYILSARGHQSFLDMSVYEALDFGAHHTFELAAGRHTRAFVAPFGFDVSYVERVYTGPDAAAVQRTGPHTVQFMVPYEFGTIRHATINDARMDYVGECHAAWCTISVSGDDHTVSFHNAWGGTAAASIPPHTGTPAVGDPATHMQTLLQMGAPLAAVSLALWVSWRIISRMRADRNRL